MQKHKTGCMIFLGFLCILALAILSFFMWQEANNRKAVSLAKDYLAQTYDQEMQYQSVRYSWIDPSLYHVTFSPAAIPELTFEVLVQTNLTILPEGMQEFGGKRSCPDNYYTAYFDWLLSAQLQDPIASLWPQGTAHVLTADGGIYGFLIPSGLNDTISLSEMAALIDEYYVYVDPNEPLNASNMQEEAQRILALFQQVQESGYCPTAIIISYLKENAAPNDNLFLYVHFQDWQKIYTLEPVWNTLQNALTQSEI